VAHPEWRNDPVMRWNSEGNALLRVLDELQVILNSRQHYRRRMPCPPLVNVSPDCVGATVGAIATKGRQGLEGMGSDQIRRLRFRHWCYREAKASHTALEVLR